MSLKQEEIDLAISKAEHFIESAKRYRARSETNCRLLLEGLAGQIVFNSDEEKACKKASMDLTRALVGVRRRI